MPGFSRVMARLAKVAKQKGSDPAIAFEQFIEELRVGLAQGVIAPLLDRMEGFFERTENKPVESLRDLEDQLSSRLTNGVERASGAAFSSFLVDGTPEPLELLLSDQLDVGVVRSELGAFFESFSANDLYVEWSDLVRSTRLIDNADFYLHDGTIPSACACSPATARVVIDAHDREALAWHAATGTGIGGSIAEGGGLRFGTVQAHTASSGCPTTVAPSRYARLRCRASLRSRAGVRMALPKPFVRALCSQGVDRRCQPHKLVAF